MFEESDPVAEIEAHFSRQPASVRSCRPEVPVELDVLTGELLAKIPSARPPEAWSVVARLLPFVIDLRPLPGIVAAANAPNPSQLYAMIQARIAPR